MKDHARQASELFHQGYNCAQSVFAAFCEELNLDRESALKISSSFGGGMARLREVCGAVSGMFMTAGMLYGYTDPKDNKAKTEHYRRIRSLAAQFKEQNGSIICRELLGLGPGPDDAAPEPRTKEYYKKRPCGELVESAAKIMDQMIKSENKTDKDEQTGGPG